MYRIPAVRRTASIVALAVAATLGTAVTAAAGESDEAENLEHRADRLCERVPRVEERVDRLLERLQGDADVRGSIEWLTERAEQARDNGHDDMATFLDHGVVIRTERIDVLNARKDALDFAATWCAERSDDQ